MRSLLPDLLTTTRLNDADWLSYSKLKRVVSVSDGWFCHYFMMLYQLLRYCSFEWGICLRSNVKRSTGKQGELTVAYFKICFHILLEGQGSRSPDGIQTWYLQHANLCQSAYLVTRHWNPLQTSSNNNNHSNMNGLCFKIIVKGGTLSLTVG